MRKPTVYEALAAKLNRAPTNEELRAELRGILYELGFSKRAIATAVKEVTSTSE
jgi:hypothetical protein